MVATDTNTNTNTTDLTKNGTNTTAKWILAGASAISAVNAGLQYKRSADLANNIPDVSGMQKTSAARQDVLAERLMMPQGLTDNQFNRSERALTEQAGGLIANVTAQARDVLANSPLVFEAMVKQAIDKSVSVQKSGMEKLNLYDVETVLGNAQAAIAATQNSSITQERITEQQRQVERERRQIDEQRNKAFQDSMVSLGKVLEQVLGGWGASGSDVKNDLQNTKAESTDNGNLDKLLEDDGSDKLLEDVANINLNNNFQNNEELSDSDYRLIARNENIDSEWDKAVGNFNNKNVLPTNAKELLENRNERISRANKAIDKGVEGASQNLERMERSKDVWDELFELYSN